eukprot:965241-Rhodomonas_salina.2
MEANLRRAWTIFSATTSTPPMSSRPPPSPSPSPSPSLSPSPPPSPSSSSPYTRHLPPARLALAITRRASARCSASTGYLSSLLLLPTGTTCTSIPDRRNAC